MSVLGWLQQEARTVNICSQHRRTTEAKLGQRPYLQLSRSPASWTTSTSPRSLCHSSNQQGIAIYESLNLLLHVEPVPPPPADNNTHRVTQTECALAYDPANRHPRNLLGISHLVSQQYDVSSSLCFPVFSSPPGWVIPWRIKTQHHSFRL